VLGLDGDLQIRSDVSAGQLTLVVDYPDPFGPVTEGSGPNMVDQVAGIVDGTVVFGDCCEPVSGSIRAATGTDLVRTIGGGYSPTLSPTGTLLGVANDDGWWLFDVDRESLELTRAFELGVPPVFDAPEFDLSFAGHGPNAEIVVAASNGETTRLRYFAPTTLAELPRQERSLPGSASSIRLDGDGEGLLWIDDGDVLYRRRAGELEADRVGSGYLAAWFV
jgi:hypothetical protein